MNKLDRFFHCNRSVFVDEHVADGEAQVLVGVDARLRRHGVESSNDAEQRRRDERRFDDLRRRRRVKTYGRVDALLLDNSEAIAQNGETEAEQVVLLQQRQVVVVELEFGQGCLGQAHLKE